MLNLISQRAVLLATIALVLAIACGGAQQDNAPTSGPTRASTRAQPTAGEPPSITIAAVGDVNLARGMAAQVGEHGAGWPFAKVASLLRDADLTVANLEMALTDRGVAEDKLYTFRAAPVVALGLAEAGIDLVSLANNHTADYGPIGVSDTLAALTDAGIAYAGAGGDEAAARRPAIVTVGGLRLAFLSYTNVLMNTFAGPEQPGVALAELEAIDDDVRAARDDADVVIVLLHSGVEYTDAPQPEQQSLARAAIDAGALLVLGHHPHTLQGWEEYGGGVIAYSLGNFVFDLDDVDREELGDRAFETAILYVTISVGEVLDVRAEPITINPFDHYRPWPATADAGAALLRRLEALNEIAGGP